MMFEKGIETAPCHGWAARGDSLCVSVSDCDLPESTEGNASFRCCTAGQTVCCRQSEATPCWLNALSSLAQQSKGFHPNQVGGTSRKGSLGQPVLGATQSLVSGHWKQAHMCLPARTGILAYVLAFLYCELCIILVLPGQGT